MGLELYLIDGRTLVCEEYENCTDAQAVIDEMLTVGYWYYKEEEITHNTVLCYVPPASIVEFVFYNTDIEVDLDDLS